jgi:RimJ/RimL family protein N-acetyltransferase
VNTRDERSDASISFRRLEHADLPTLTCWLNTAHVYAWWGAARGEGNLGGAGDDAASVADVRAEYGPEIDAAGPTHYFVIELDRAPVGMIQWYRLADDEDTIEYAATIGETVEGTAGIDLLIGEVASIGRGLGPKVIDAFVATVVFAADGITRCVAGPELGNTRSIRAFKKAGFRAVRDAVVPGEPDPERIMVRDRGR